MHHPGVPLEESAPSRWRHVAVLAAAFCLALLYIAVPKASASESHYCWGSTVEPGTQCDPPYIYDAAWASGAEHSICLQPWFHHEKTKCTSGPGDSVYLESTDPEGEPFAIIPNAKGSTKVYAVGFYYPSRHEGKSGGGGGESPPPPEWHTENLGGSITGTPDVSSWGSGRLDIFGLNANGSLSHRWWNGTAWSGWENVGSAGTFAAGVGAAGASGKDINVVGRASNNEAVDEWWNGSSWQLEHFGGSIVGTPDFASPINGERADLWARGTNNTLEHRWWTGTAWSPWTSTGVTIASSPGATSWASNRTDVVTRAPNGSVQGSPTIASWAPGRLDVFVRGEDNALWTNWFEGGEWHTWHSLGGNLASDPGVASWGPGRLDVVARLANGTVQHWWWQQ
jgi:hypothetical protein